MDEMNKMEMCLGIRRWLWVENGVYSVSDGGVELIGFLYVGIGTLERERNYF